MLQVFSILTEFISRSLCFALHHIY